jgi:hypothetical protein
MIPTQVLARYATSVPALHTQFITSRMHLAVVKYVPVGIRPNFRKNFTIRLAPRDESSLP